VCEQGRAQVDEDALFRMAGQMRTISETAAKTTRKARRDTERRFATPPGPAAAAPAVPPGPGDGGTPAAAAFDVIEEW
jgi:putative transposase